MEYNNKNWEEFGRLFLSRRSRPIHFTMMVGEKRITYCYIRKNACTAFKKLFLARSPAARKPAPRENPIGFLIRHHRASFPADYWRANHVIFVYRDPIERVASVFRNKFIERKENGDIFWNFERLTGANPQACTFRDFVNTYIKHDWEDLDPHLRPQFHHLLPVRYTDAIPMNGLHASMVGIVGEDVADAFFKIRANASQIEAVAEQPDESVCDIPADVLARQLCERGVMPSTARFLDGPILRTLRYRYKEDIDLVEDLETRRRDRSR